MARLWLLRHAKSAWDDPDLEDHERPLSPRGLRACEVLRAHCAGRVAPDRTVCSTATRTRQTVARVFPDLPLDAVRFDPEVYEASPAQLVRRIECHGAGVDSLLLVGHNPGIQELALWLAAPGTATRAVLLERVARKVPTGALVTMALDELTALRRGCADLLEMVTPKKLAAR